MFAWNLAFYAELMIFSLFNITKYVKFILLLNQENVPSHMSSTWIQLKGIKEKTMHSKEKTWQ